MKHELRIIGFDAGDTLWDNEIYFREAEREFCEILSDIQEINVVIKRLYEIEIRNIEYYGCGIKRFVLSMIETALTTNKFTIPQKRINDILEIGKNLLNKPINLIDGVKNTLDILTQKSYKLMIVTKGDLLDQKRKLNKSNISHYFHHIEIMSEKTEQEYSKLLSKLAIKPNNFLMVGNSMKSDINPVLNIGGFGVYLPHKHNWIHENVVNNCNSNNFLELEKIEDLIRILNCE
jgi:putative hydrolase of the HAD superfamily